MNKNVSTSDNMYRINGVVVTWVVAIRLVSTRRGFDSPLVHVFGAFDFDLSDVLP